MKLDEMTLLRCDLLRMKNM